MQKVKISFAYPPPCITLNLSQTSTPLIMTINFNDRQAQVQFQATLAAGGELQSLTANGHPVEFVLIPANEYEDMPWVIKFFNPLTGADMSISPSHGASHGINVVEYERLVHPLQVTASV